MSITAVNKGTQVIFTIPCFNRTPKAYGLHIHLCDCATVPVKIVRGKQTSLHLLGWVAEVWNQKVAKTDRDENEF